MNIEHMIPGQPDARRRKQKKSREAQEALSSIPLVTPDDVKTAVQLILDYLELGGETT
jgi:hypothetical protein